MRKKKMEREGEEKEGGEKNTKGGREGKPERENGKRGGRKRMRVRTNTIEKLENKVLM